MSASESHATRLSTPVSRDFPASVLQAQGRSHFNFVKMREGNGCRHLQNQCIGSSGVFLRHIRFEQNAGVEVGAQYSPLASSRISQKTGFPLTPLGNVLFASGLKIRPHKFFGLWFHGNEARNHALAFGDLDLFAVFDPIQNPCKIVAYFADSCGFHVLQNVSRNVNCQFRKNTIPLVRSIFQTAPGEGRTHNLWLRRPTLYPVELRARSARKHGFANSIMAH